MKKEAVRWTSSEDKIIVANRWKNCKEINLILEDAGYAHTLRQVQARKCELVGASISGTRWDAQSIKLVRDNPDCTSKELQNLLREHGYDRTLNAITVYRRKLVGRKFKHVNPRVKIGDLVTYGNGETYIKRDIGYMRYSHYVWNMTHPDDMVLGDEVVIHLNGDFADFTPNTLCKVTKEQLVRLNYSGGIPKGTSIEGGRVLVAIAQMQCARQARLKASGMKMTDIYPRQFTAEQKLARNERSKRRWQEIVNDPDRLDKYREYCREYYKKNRKGGKNGE